MRVLCRFALSAAAAIFLSVTLLPPGLLLPLAAVFGLVGLLTRLLPAGNRRRKAALLAWGLAFGLLWSGGYDRLFHAPARALENTDQIRTCTVADYPSENQFGGNVPVLISTSSESAVRATLFAEPDEVFASLLPGDEITARLEISASRGHRNTVGTSYAAHGTFLLVYGSQLQMSVHPDRIPLRFAPRVFSHGLKQVMARCFPADVSGFASTLVTGDKTALPPGLYAAFQRTGLAHIVAVSGLHISFLIAAITLILGKGKRSTALIGMALAGFFALSVGSSPSVLRSVFMAGMLLLAPLVDREPDKPTTLSFILLILLLQCPDTAYSIGLQLSFAAVAGIYLITPGLSARWNARLPKWKTVPGRICRRSLAAVQVTAATTLGATLFTAPLVALYFRTFSLAALAANLLTLWAVSLTFLGALLAGVTGLLLPPLGSLLAQFTAWPARWVMATAVRAARIPFASVSLSTPCLLLWFVLSYAALLVLLARRGRGVRPLLPVCACLICLTAALALDLYPVRSSALTLSVLDVGKGSSSLISAGGETVLVNCGSAGARSAGDAAAEQLLALGRTELDAVVLTSCRLEHAGGVPQLLARVDAKRLLLPEREWDSPAGLALRHTAERLGCKSFPMAGDYGLACGPARITVFEPMTWETGRAVLCTLDDFDVLLTPGLDRELERRLVRYKTLPDAEVLVVGSYGGDDASEELLLAVTPEHAVIPTARNQYRRPLPQTLERLGAAGCCIYRTDLMGTVTFTIPRK